MNKDTNPPIESKGYLALVVIMPLAVFLLPLIKGDVLFWGLPATQFVPWRVFAWQQLTQGLIPLWNPLNGLGAPLLANYQLAFFYPPGWILYGLMAIGGSEWLAWGHLLVNTLHLTWAALGMSLFMRSLGVGRFGQAVSGLGFGLCGYFIARIGTSSMIWAGAWLPWLMLGGNHLIAWATNQRKHFPILPAIVLSFQLLAGHAQLTWYSILLVSGWIITSTLVHGKLKSIIKSCVGWGGLIIVSLCITAVQLLPTAELLLESQRSQAVDYEIGLTYSFWPWRLLTFLSPDFFGNPARANYLGYASYWEDAVYIGVIPLILALTTFVWILRKWQKNEHAAFFRAAVFFWIIIAVGLLFALGKNTPIYTFFYQYIPTFDMFNAPARYMIWVEFGLAALAGLAAEVWKKPTGKNLIRLKLITVAAFAVSVGAGLTGLLLGQVRSSFITATVTAGILGVGFCLLTLTLPSENEKRRKWILACFLVMCIDLLFNFGSSTPTTTSSLFSSSIPTKSPMISDGERLFIGSQDEYTLKYQRFFRFDDFTPIEDWFNLRRISLPNMNLLEGVAMVNNFDPLVPARYAWVIKEMEGMDEAVKLNFYKWLNVGIVESKDSYKPLGINLTKVSPWGRFRWVPCAISVDNPTQAWEETTKLLSGSSDETPAYIVLENPDMDIGNCSGNSYSSIQIVEATSQRMVLKTHSDVEGYFLVADEYYPGWRVQIDGKETNIVRADYLFYAFQLPRGDKRIVIEYKPESFYIGAVITGISLIIVIISVVIKLMFANHSLLRKDLPGD